jgi:3-dehydroquinate dehydratase type I
MVEEAGRAPSDLVELRLDYLSDFSGLERLSKVGKEKIATCMPKWEGGLFSGAEEERIDVLRRCLAFADYATVELRTDEGLRRSLITETKKKKVKAIVAFHDFKKTPSKEKIISILNEEKSAGADIAKAAFMAADDRDVLSLMRVLVEVRDDPKFKIPVIAVSMGEAGKISRIVAPLLGSYLTYVSATKGRESAPGQLSFEEMETVLSALEGK